METKVAQPTIEDCYHWRGMLAALVSTGEGQRWQAVSTLFYILLRQVGNIRKLLEVHYFYSYGIYSHKLLFLLTNGY